MSEEKEPLGLLVTIYGMGGYALDPANGMRRIAQRGIAQGWQGRGEPYNYTDSFTLVTQVKQFRSRWEKKPIAFIGDSCGANVIAQLVAWVAPIEVAYAGIIQASSYCNFNYPALKPNLRRVRIFYSDFAHTFGLGTFVPQPQSTPAKPQIDIDGWHLVNSGATRYRADYVPAFHPDDNDIARVQDPIFLDLKLVLEEVK